LLHVHVAFWIVRRNSKAFEEIRRTSLAGGDADDRATDWGTNTGHGHVWKRPDGLMVRCGGPSICTICARDEKQPKPPIPATQDAQGGRFLPNGTRVIWQSSNGTEFPATITAWHAETYDAVLDDGCDAKGFARGRFKLPANARRAEGGECKLLSDLVRTAPDAIYLQVSDEAWHSEKEFPRDHDGISWCEDSVLACEVKYIRADLAIGESHEG